MILFTSCSQKISQLDYDKKIYEYDQLKIRYDLLRKEVDGSTSITTNTITKKTETNTADYEQLKQKYDKLLRQHASLQTAYNELETKDEGNKPIPPGTVSKIAYNVVKTELLKDPITNQRIDTAFTAFEGDGGAYIVNSMKP